MRLAVYCDTGVVVTVPHGVPIDTVEKFVDEKKEWIEEKIAYFTRFKNKSVTKTNAIDFVKYKDEALALVTERVMYFNQFYGFSYNKINVKNQKTRWGSCSAKGNLNFNYKIIFLPEDVQNYIVVHELCHLKEFNHSKKFWNLVRQTLPDFQEIKSSLRDREIVVK